MNLPDSGAAQPHCGTYLPQAAAVAGRSVVALDAFENSIRRRFRRIALRIFDAGPVSGTSSM